MAELLHSCQVTRDTSRRASAARGNGNAYTPQLMAGKATVARPSLFASSRQLLHGTSRPDEPGKRSLVEVSGFSRMFSMQPLHGTSMPWWVCASCIADERSCMILAKKRLSLSLPI